MSCHGSDLNSFSNGEEASIPNHPKCPRFLSFIRVTMIVMWTTFKMYLFQVTPLYPCCSDAMSSWSVLGLRNTVFVLDWLFYHYYYCYLFQPSRVWYGHSLMAIWNYTNSSQKQVIDPPRPVPYISSTLAEHHKQILVNNPVFNLSFSLS